MNNLIQHLVKDNLDEIVDMSLLNCHVRGLHSVMLLNSPQKTIRLFVADTNHELEDNNIFDVSNGRKMTVGFHPHHCNLTLNTVKGVIMNWVVKENPNGLDITKFYYESGIKNSNGKAGFIFAGDTKVQTLRTEFLFNGHSTHLQANELHTVACEAKKVAAWLVFEGKEDPNYIPFTYSNADLDNADFSDLYKKADKNDVLNLLELAGYTNLR